MKTKKKLLSVCIPTYPMRGLGPQFLKHSLSILSNQTFKDFEVVISDYSEDNQIKKVVNVFKNKMTIKYVLNTQLDVPSNKRMSVNTNNALAHATGKLAKILFLDDFLYDKYSLQHTVEAFNLKEDQWLVSACEHSMDGITYIRPHYPRYNDDIILGNNTISSPSVLTIKNSKQLFFDENLTWLMDCDYYKRCYDMFGKPKILNTITVVNRLGKHQISNVEATKALKKAEYDYISIKYGIATDFFSKLQRKIIMKARNFNS